MVSLYARTVILLLLIYAPFVGVIAVLLKLWKIICIFVYIVITRFMKYQNVFFTLALGLILITIMSELEKKYSKEMVLLNIYNALLTIGFCAIAVILRTDYNLCGILLIVAFYLFRQSNALCGIAIFLVLGFLQGDPFGALFATSSILFIRKFNGEKGKDVKYLFYIFYPVHLLFLFLITLMVVFFISNPYLIRAKF
jgi:hypothetical protein